MTSSKARTRTDISEVVYIPPLRLPEYFESSPKLHKSKESLGFLQPVPLDQNEQFLKQKSLYRYTISRKLNRFDNNKSSTNSLLARNTTQNSRERDQASSMKRSQSKEGSYLEKQEESEEEKQRHFKRKNKNQFQKSSSQLHGNTTFSAVNQNKKIIYYQKANNNNIQLASEETKEESFLNVIKELERENQTLNKENISMKDVIRQKNKQLETFQQQIKVLKRENQRLLHEVQRNLMSHSESFINDQKMENQLRFRDMVIEQLQSSIKYIELQNITLKKSKNQSQRQAQLIRTLEGEKRILQQKVKKLYRQKTKRRNMKGSLISECSDLSLNLSFDQQDSDKYFEGLKTSERTPQKPKNVQHYKASPLGNKCSQVSTTDWKIKNLKK